MTETVLVPGRRLGRRRPDPERAKRQLRIGDYLRFRALELTPPDAVDHLSRVPEWGLYRNDQFGVCGPTAAANLRRMLTLYVTGTMRAPSQDDVDALYALQNPGFDPATSEPGGPQDQGVDLQTMCDQLISTGIGGVKALGHASVDVTSPAELRECLTLFGGLLLGVDLEQAQQTQSDAGIWNYDPTPDWGGHAVMFGRYASNPDQSDVISWAKPVIMTDQFVQQQLLEAHVIIWPENLQLGAFQRGVDLQALAADYKALTGRDFPMPPSDPAIDASPPVAPPADPTPPVPAPVAPGDNSITDQINALVQQEIDTAVATAVNGALQDVRGILNQIQGSASQLDQLLKAHGA